jgi:hypothetical protein
VKPTGTVFPPELLELMKSVLEDAMAMLPEPKRTSTVKAEIASHILADAAKGERDPIALKMAAGRSERLAPQKIASGGPAASHRARRSGRPTRRPADTVALTHRTREPIAAAATYENYESCRLSESRHIPCGPV